MQDYDHNFGPIYLKFGTQLPLNIMKTRNTFGRGTYHWTIKMDGNPDLDRHQSLTSSGDPWAICRTPKDHQNPFDTPYKCQLMSYLVTVNIVDHLNIVEWSTIHERIRINGSPSKSNRFVFGSSCTSHLLLLLFLIFFIPLVVKIPRVKSVLLGFTITNGEDYCFCHYY